MKFSFAEKIKQTNNTKNLFLSISAIKENNIKFHEIFSNFKNMSDLIAFGKYWLLNMTVQEILKYL